MIESLVLAMGGVKRAEAAVLDPNGRLHVVVYDIAEADSKVRYLRFGARPE